MFDILPYTPDKADEWNRFVAQSKNGTFLFDRRYMDYHSDRFVDRSVMIYTRGTLYALLPANIVGDTLYSHRGLTYGGLIMSRDSRAAAVRRLFIDLNQYLRSCGVRRVEYKPVPHIYSSIPSDEDLFALHNVCHASVTSRDVASVVVLSDPIPFTTLRRRGVSKGERCQLQVQQSPDWASFWTVLEDNLQRRHRATPVHTLKEIIRLSASFPENIRLFVVKHNNAVLGGTVIYETPLVAKTQYISASEDGRACGALDFLFARLLTLYAGRGVRYFDFGTSNLVTTDDLNEPLIFQKEGFGGRALCYDKYEWIL